ncbi:MAG: S8 family serine peptidase [Chloroflexi bacterium]|nr:S8 family serine peptidase [Chloroflexota bacterium]
MRAALIAFAILTLAALCSGAAHATPPAQTPKAGAAVRQALAAQPRVPVIVTLRTPALRGRIAATQASVLSALPAADFTLARRYRTLPAIAGQVTAAGLATLEARADVVDIALDIAVRAGLEESVPQVHADMVHALGFTGEGIVVAVLDSGIDTDHPDLSGDLLSEACFLNPVFVEPCHNGQPSDSGPGSAEDDNGHGTHVSGIITGDGTIAPAGVAPAAGIRAYKILDSTGTGEMSDIIAALDDIMANYPDTDLVNLSVGDGGQHAPGSCEGILPAFDDAVAALRDQGTTVIAASGNDGDKNATGYPACLSAVISAGAVYDADLGSFTTTVCSDPTTAQDQVTCFSNSDSSLDLLAPGCATTAAAVGGGAATYCGTSMAAPHAAGVAALVLQHAPALTSEELELCLESSGTPIVDAGNGLTKPRVDALAALSCGPVGGVATIGPLALPPASGGVPWLPIAAAAALGVGLWGWWRAHRVS